MHQRLGPLIKTGIFSVVVPGSAAYLVPWLIRIYGPAWFGTLPVVAQVAGLSGIVTGTAMYCWCAWDFATTGLGTPAPIDPPTIVVTRGLYRYTRNPMYVAVTLVNAGQSLYFGAGAVALYTVVLWTIFHLFVVGYEEPHLRKTFGHAYREYCARVPRWLGRRGHSTVA